MERDTQRALQLTVYKLLCLPMHMCWWWSFYILLLIFLFLVANQATQQTVAPHKFDHIGNTKQPVAQEEVE